MPDLCTIYDYMRLCGLTTYVCKYQSCCRAARKDLPNFRIGDHSPIHRFEAGVSTDDRRISVELFTTRDTDADSPSDRWLYMRTPSETPACSEPRH
jgi:hypothetical protein